MKSMFRIIFSLFLFLFFLSAQNDVLTLLRSLVVHRPVEPYPLLTALLLTLVMYGLVRGVTAVLHRFRYSATIAYVSVSWLSVVLVSLPFAGLGRHFVLLLTAVVLALLGEYWTKRLDRKWGSRRNLWQNFFPPVLRLLVLGLYMGIGAAATDYEHFELRTAESIRSRNLQKAYTVGETSLACSPRLFAMRSYLMAVTAPQRLGNEVFKQPIPLHSNGAALLFPDDELQPLLLPADSLSHLLGAARRQGEAPVAYLKRCAYAEKERKAKQAATGRVAADYYLCALLLDRNLDTFAREISQFYSSEIASCKLPRYYAEALVFYIRSRMHPVVSYRNSAIETNFRDYVELERKLKHSAERYNMLRRSYGETYWWWYTYAK